jgi:hypothetical protein
LKLQQYLDSATPAGSPLTNGQTKLIDINIRELQGYKYLALLCVQVWDSNSKAVVLRESLDRLFKELLAKGVKSLCITDFNAEFGVPVHVGVGAIATVSSANCEEL